MALRDFEAFLATPGAKTDAEVVSAMNANGVTAADVARLTNLPVDEVSARVNAVRETNFTDFLMTPDLTDAQIVQAINQNSISPERVSALTNVPLAEVQQRIAAVSGAGGGTKTGGNTTTTGGNTTTTSGNTTTTGGNTTTTGGNTNLSQFQNFLMTPDLIDAQILAEMNRLGISAQQVAGITGMPINQVQNRISNLLPFSNATQGFEQNFRNYTSIPIGAQYNPNVTGGLSPYGQVMGQMQPLTNPYATVQSGLSMGGYDPNIYDRNLLSNFVAKRAADAAATTADNAATNQAGEGGGSGFDGGGGGGDSGYGTNVAGGYGAGGYGANDNFGGFFKGGLINQVAGADPAGPDEGQINAQKGEYVVKKSSVKKYGKGVLDMINDGKIPAKKIKSLLD